MGKVLSTFTNGFPGAIARSLDDVVVAFANKSGVALAFGVPIALDSTKTGVVLFDPETHTGDDFVGITVRTPSKTPDTYGSNTGSYAADDLVDVLVRGHIIGQMDSWNGGMGDHVSVNASNGYFSISTGTGYVALPNVRLFNTPDANSRAELVATERNIM